MTKKTDKNFEQIICGTGETLIRYADREQEDGADTVEALRNLIALAERQGDEDGPSRVVKALLKSSCRRSLTIRLEKQFPHLDAVSIDAAVDELGGYSERISKIVERLMSEAVQAATDRTMNLNARLKALDKESSAAQPQSVAANQSASDDGAISVH